MPRYHIRNATLYKWFPKDDKVAANIARLCILREDFFLEFKLAYEDSIPSTDDNGIDWRKIYSFRALCKSLAEISRVVDTLSKDKLFKELLKNSPHVSQSFKRLKKNLSQGEIITKDIRNEIGAHIKQDAILETLKDIDLEKHGILQIGDDWKSTHYKFVNELIMSLICRRMPLQDQENHLKKILDKFIKIVHAFIDSVDILIIEYAKSRKLI